MGRYPCRERVILLPIAGNTATSTGKVHAAFDIRDIGAAIGRL
jgi:hypothetical protein